MSTREILTLQFGHYSNYVGAHFWNTQELSFDYTGTVVSECNHDILYREGQTVRGETTYTPRLLISDLKGSLKTLSTSGGLPKEHGQDDHYNWDNIEKIEEPQAEKNEYLEDIDGEGASIVEQRNYDFEQITETWTDFFYPRLHSRSVNVVKQYQHGVNNEFDISLTGQTLWKSDYGEVFSDNIRKYVEECDSLQGFQVNFDCTDGFAGLAMSCIQDLTDDYNKTILTYPIIASNFSDNNPITPEERDTSNLKDSVRLVNIALSLEILSEYCTMFIPICTGERGWRKPGNARTFEHINYNPEIYYHSSALLSSAIDTLGQKYRSKNNLYTISDVCADMTGYGRKMVAASLGMPLAMNESQYLIDYLNETTKPIYTSITPSCKIATDKIFQTITIRGIPESYLKAPPKEAKEQKNLPAYKCNSVKEMFELYFQATNFLSATSLTICEKPIQLKSPYPKIFSDKLNTFGFVTDTVRNENMKSCPVIAGYHNGTFLSDTIERLHREVSRIKFAKLHKFKEEGLEAAEYKECLDRLSEFKDNYEDDFEL